MALTDMWKLRQSSTAKDKVFRSGAVIAKRYRVLGQVAQGGHGIVLVALDTHTESHVAIKALLPQHRGTDARHRFEREAKLLARIQSPYVIAVRDFGIHKGAQWMAMPYYHESCDLWSLMKSFQSTVPLDVAVDIISNVATGLEHMHLADIIHRDLNTRNILYVPALHLAIIIDLGLGRDTTAVTETVSGVLVGSVGYMAPEVQRGERGDHRSDIYSFGVLADQLLSGRVYSHDGTPPSTIRENAKPFDNIVMRSLEIRPADRFQSASELRQALRDALNGLSQEDFLQEEDIVLRRDVDSEKDTPDDAIASSSSLSWHAFIDTKETRRRSLVKLALSVAPVIVLAAIVALGVFEVFQGGRKQPQRQATQTDQSNHSINDEQLTCSISESEILSPVMKPQDPAEQSGVTTTPTTARRPFKPPRKHNKKTTKPAKELKNPQDQETKTAVILKLGDHRIEVPEGSNLRINVK